MTYKLDDQVIGYPNIEGVVAAPATLNLLPITSGFIAVGEDPVWGPGEFIFARAGAGIRLYGLCVLTPVWDATNQTFQMNMTEVPNTALLGRPVYVYQGNVALTTGQYGWFMMTGTSPVNGSATVAADTIVGITAAGQIGANTAGKAMLGARCVQAATATVAKAGVGASGDNTIYFPSGTQGLFVGGYVAGTGVGAAAIITAVFADRITVSVVNSAAVSSTVTQTANNTTIFYNVVTMNRPIAQGPIT